MKPKMQSKIDLKMQSHLDLTPPSSWVQRFAHLVKSGGSLLDVACGAGRHSQLFAGMGCAVTALDVSGEALAIVSRHSPSVRTVQADIENANWPLRSDGVYGVDGTNDQFEAFDAIIVTHYLHRPLMPTLLASLADGGVLIYETFAAGNESVGKPSRPDFLLQRGELLALCQDLNVVAFEDGFLSSPDRFVQRIVATKMHRSLELPLPLRFHL
jgi:SAM-dependent methyltransferase